MASGAVAEFLRAAKNQNLTHGEHRVEHRNHFFSPNTLGRSEIAISKGM
jgi:hypothetical protein